MKKLFLLDGSAIIYRAFYSMIRNPLTRSDGFNTSSIFGSINIFLNLIKRLKLENILISFDESGKTFRSDIFPLYKANRQKTPEDLIVQIEPIKDFFKSIKVCNFSLLGFEADDVLASAAKKFSKEFEVVIISSDKDFIQIIDEPKIVQFDPVKNIFLDTPFVEKKYGIKPHQFIDFLAIAGDSSDNIPGVSGIGAKGATKLLQQFKSLEQIYKNLDKISSQSIKQKLMDSKKNAFLSYKLAKIKDDIKLDITSDELKFKKENFEGGLNFLKKYELNSLTKKVTDFLPPKTKQNKNFIQMNIFDKPAKPKFKFTVIKNCKEFNQLLEKIEEKQYIAIKFWKQKIKNGKIVGIALTTDGKKCFYISLKNQKEFDIKKLYKKLKTVIYHDIKEEISNFADYNISFFDTKIASYLIDPNDHRHTIEHLSRKDLGTEIDTSKYQKNNFNKISSNEIAPIISENVITVYKLFEFYSKIIDKSKFKKLFYEIEIPLIQVLADMEKTGVYIDIIALKKFEIELEIKLKELTERIYFLAGEEFNIASPQQLATVLFEKLNIKPVKKGKTGFSTDVTVLEQLDHKIADFLLDYRSFSKLQNTYVKALPKLINKTTNRIHSHFNQAVTTTGRLSCTKPNLQNIPIRSSVSHQIRRAFVPQSKTGVIVSADYSQVELRILALLSKEKNLITSFIKGEDIHLQTAKLIFSKVKIEPSERRIAKTINFGIIYGMGARKLSKEIGVTYKMAKEFIKNYFDKLPNLKHFIKSQQEFAEKNGYVQTLFGRRLILKGINSSNKMFKSFAQRIAVNMPIQGTAADIMKIAMINIHSKIKGNKDIKMVIQVHDELVFEVEKQSLKKVIRMIKYEMEKILPESLPVNLRVDIGWGNSWYDAH